MERTQIYLTTTQRRALKRLARRRGVSMAELIREGIDTLLRRDELIDPDQALERTLGVLPDLEVPDRSEWDRVGA